MIAATPNHRTSEVDVLRGFALLGIAVVNVPLFSEPWTGTPAVETRLDALSALIGGTFFTAKFFGLFAFLFGWAMVRLNESAVSKGLDPGRVWRRRMLILVGIGLAHGILVFTYDILMIYGILGLILSKAATWSRERLVKHAMFGLLAVPFCYVFLMWWTVSGYDYEVEDGVKFGAYRYALIVEDNLFSLPDSQFVNVLYNGAMSYAAICLGILAAREGFFEKGSLSFGFLERHLSLILFVGIALNLPFGILCALGEAGGAGAYTLSMGLVGLGAPWLTTAYIVMITRWCRKRTTTGFFEAVGRMSLTAYVLEGILAGWVFYEYGLGWNMELGAAGTFACALGIFGLTKILCMAWLRFRNQGPLETLWRKLVHADAPVDRHAR